MTATYALISLIQSFKIPAMVLANGLWYQNLETSNIRQYRISNINIHSISANMIGYTTYRMPQHPI